VSRVITGMFFMSTPPDPGDSHLSQSPQRLRVVKQISSRKKICLDCNAIGGCSESFLHQTYFDHQSHPDRGCLFGMIFSSQKSGQADYPRDLCALERLQRAGDRIS
jgi:hypothetical protein